MSKLSTDISKVKRLSLGKLPAPGDEPTEIPPPESKELLNSSELLAIAEKTLKPMISYSQREIIIALKEAYRITWAKAEEDFNLMLRAGVIKPTSLDKYYLPDYTLF